MTNEEAIKYFKDPLNYTYEGIPVNISKENEAVDLALEALEKQIPKKPFIRHGNIPILDVQLCPNCKSFDIEGDEGEKLDYCTSCGQAIDWSE